MITAVEVYLRDVTKDSHAESSYTSYPQQIDINDRYYRTIKVMINNQAEGGQSIDKLVIGTTTLNILITGTFTLAPRCDELSKYGWSCCSIRLEWL